jgi:23S rRNA pseudouridine2604 synthase
MCVQPGTIRINKFLSDSGFCSRRDADYLIEDGRVTIDGTPATVGMSVSRDQEICVDGKRVDPDVEMILLAVNKPVGIVCTTDSRERYNIVDFIGLEERIFHAGRLDKDSEGLVLMTNNGDLVNSIARSRYDHEKEYVVTVHKPITKKFIEKMGAGIPILGTVTRKCFVERIGKQKFRIILTQGINRQIRRMCQYLGFEVISLKRVRIMNIELGNLKEGEYRKVSKEEMTVLFDMIRGSKEQRSSAADAETGLVRSKHE